ncbi:beta-lactamase [Paraburkholderia dinghuensis]|uniref:Beta-lactamase n=2 Tax=Paraburkholderia dinghuensis TaxID=2305225 RepID=A0A3N6N3H1_9BURK|nr:class C beta-lactamase [Paraburkholderia dinghuensis]RQH02187.1 beta-lactamase [Paraburkholderia dinghuensis]
MKFILRHVAMATFTVCLIAPAVAAGVVAGDRTSRATPDRRTEIRHVVDAAIQPLMREYGIPGAAVGVTVDGRSYVFDYGVASKETGKPVNGDTLFELGSVSKTFTATLASWASEEGKLSFADPVAHHWPALDGTPFGAVTLLQLGTHTPGGMPLQVPDEIHGESDLLAYLKAWRPAYPPGTERTYSNVSVGTLGLVTAKVLEKPFPDLMEQRLFPALHLSQSYIVVPPARMGDYAQGYTKNGEPVRMKGDVLSSESYGVRATAADVLRFVEVNLGVRGVEPGLRQAISATHIGYFRAGPMTQDLIWEQYAWPVTLDTLLDGNAPKAIDPTPSAKIDPPLAPSDATWINKTGSTNGFGSYVAFVPARRIGIVILSNRNYPIAARVTAAYKIFTALDSGR